jgi:hypothetical protein
MLESAAGRSAFAPAQGEIAPALLVRAGQGGTVARQRLRAGERFTALQAEGPLPRLWDDRSVLARNSFILAALSKELNRARQRSTR